MYLKVISIIAFSCVINFNSKYCDAISPSTVSTTKSNALRNNCHSNSNCTQNGDLNQVCVDNLCRCKPNYKWSINNTCTSYECSKDKECHEYDSNRICKNSQCFCLEGYSGDAESKKCISLYKNTTTPSHVTTPVLNINCNKTSNCGSNQFCINYKCECRPGFEYSHTFNECIQNKCNVNTNCEKYDKNSYCNEGSCDCKIGYKIDPKTKICKKTFKKSCKSISDCSSNQFCVKNHCECQPNYVFNNISNSCEYKYCHYNSDCNQFDTLRHCSGGNCECSNHHVIDSNTKLCNVTIGMFCKSNYDCTKSGDSNQVCVDNGCQCIPDYQMHYHYGFCLYKSCSRDSDCQKYDEHRVCNNLCLCDTHYREDPYSKKCVYTYPYFWWLWMVLLILAILTIISVHRVCKRRNTGVHTSNMSITSKSPIVHFNNYMPDDSQKATINDVSPPYSKK